MNKSGLKFEEQNQQTDAKDNALEAKIITEIAALAQRVTSTGSTAASSTSVSPGPGGGGRGVARTEDEDEDNVIEVKGFAKWGNEEEALMDAEVVTWLQAVKDELGPKAELVNWDRTNARNKHMFLYKILIVAVNREAARELKKALEDVVQQVRMPNSKHVPKVGVKPPAWKLQLIRAGAIAFNKLAEKGIDGDRLRADWGPTFQNYLKVSAGRPVKLLSFSLQGGWALESQPLADLGIDAAALLADLKD